MGRVATTLVAQVASPRGESLVFSFLIASEFILQMAVDPSPGPRLCRARRRVPIDPTEMYLQTK